MLTEKELMDITNFIRQRSQDFHLIFDENGQLTAGEEKIPVSERKLMKILVEDTIAANVTQLRGRRLNRLINSAIKNTKKIAIKYYQKKNSSSSFAGVGGQESNLH